MRINLRYGHAKDLRNFMTKRLQNNRQGFREALAGNGGRKSLAARDRLTAAAVQGFESWAGQQRQPPVNAGEILQRLAGGKVQQVLKQ